MDFRPIWGKDLKIGLNQKPSNINDVIEEKGMHLYKT